jgi:ACR3 family arsenite efflux pump ArsB
MVVVILLIALSILSKDWSVFELLITVFLLLTIPVVVGIVTWLKHENQSDDQVV